MGQGRMWWGSEWVLAREGLRLQEGCELRGRKRGQGHLGDREGPGVGRGHKSRRQFAGLRVPEEKLPLGAGKALGTVLGMGCSQDHGQ